MAKAARTIPPSEYHVLARRVGYIVLLLCVANVLFTVFLGEHLWARVVAMFMAALSSKFAWLLIGYAPRPASASAEAGR
jgi:hypothetical protein